MASFVCKICQATYIEKKNLNKHARKHHPSNLSEIIDNALVRRTKCAACETKVFNMKELLVHVSEIHNTQVNTCDLIFNSESDFQTWLKKEEKTNDCSFVCRNSCKGSKKYLCHRSGHYNSLAVLLRKRQLKQIGSCKINGTCTAYISLKEVAGQLKVHYCSTHFGHQRDLVHLRLPEDEKKNIAEKLVQGIPGKRIIRDLQGKGKIERTHITNRQDLANIARQYGISQSSGMSLPVIPTETCADTPSAPDEGENITKNILELSSDVSKICTGLPSMELSPAVLNGMLAHLEAFIELASLNGYENSQLPPQTKEPVNKKISPQPRFKSVKKVRRKKNCFLKKVTNAAEELSTSNRILHGEILNVLQRAGAEHNYC